MNQLEQVIGAIETFYSPSTPAQLRHQTGKALEAFQNTVKWIERFNFFKTILFSFRFTPGMLLWNC